MFGLNLSELLLQEIGRLCGGLDSSSSSSALFLLLATGYSGKSAGEWYGLMHSLGVIHLLVLSGSQVGHILGLFSLAKGLALRLAFPRGAIFLFEGAAWLMLVLIQQICDFDPPFVRASLYAFLGRALPGLSTSAQMLVVFSLQLLLFPDHGGRLGFILSWASFLALNSSQWIPTMWQRNLWVSFVSQLTVCAILGKSLSFSFWCLLLVVNFFFVPLFERIVFPVVAMGLLIAFFSTLCVVTLNFSLSQALSPIWAPMMELLSAGVVVATSAFRYIYY